MTALNPETIVIARRFDYPIESVFDAWLDPARASKFLFATPTATMVRVDIDARVGGAFNITRRDGEDIEHIGKYQEIDRPRRLVFSFGVPKFSTLLARISIDLKPLATGCELTLTQKDTPAEWVERTRDGWAKILDGLSTNLAKSRSIANDSLDIPVAKHTLRLWVGW